MTEAKNTLIAIVAIAILGMACISQSLNGQILALAIVAIAGLGGYEVYRRGKGESEG